MYTAEYTVSSADTWEKKTIVIPGESNLVFNEDTGSGLELLFMLANASGRYGAAGSWTTGNHYGTSNQVNFLDSTSNIMYLTGVKLEIGDTATDYVHKSSKPLPVSSLKTRLDSPGITIVFFSQVSADETVYSAVYILLPESAAKNAIQ